MPRACASRSTSTLAAHAPVGAPATWLLSNHDVTRPVTRYGRADTSFAFARKRRGTPTDLDLGRRRARAAALLCAALPGSLYIYQGEELGLEEVQDLPASSSQDPMYFRSRRRRSRPRRLPRPAAVDRRPRRRSASAPTARRHEPWLRQPEGWAALTVEAQLADPGSMLNLYRAALRIRRPDAQLGDGSLRGSPSADGVLAFARGAGFVCVTNLSPAAIELPAAGEVLLASARLDHGRLPADATAWIRPDASSPASAGPSTREAA